MIQTNWGYTLTSATDYTDFLTVAEFNTFTGNKFTGDVRIAPNIKSATRSIQNYCGWHVYPNLECEMTYRILDLRDCFIGSDLLIQLPSTYVTDISSVLLNAELVEGEWVGDSTTDFDFERSGLLRIYNVSAKDRRSKIRVIFKSGFGSGDIDVIKELTAHRVTHAVSSSYGINSESAGGVSVSYNSAWAGNTRSTALPDDNKEILNAYRVKGVF